MTRPVLLVAAAALFDAEGRILLAQRPQGKSMAGLWEFPGGKVETGETPEDALSRELKEELGLDIVPGAFTPVSFASHAYETFHLLMPLFAAHEWAGDPTPMEGQALSWVQPKDLASYPAPTADIPLFAALSGEPEWRR